jgi:hypothetical protein
MRTALLALLLSSLPCSASDWIRLFDGKSLAGWRVESKPADAGKPFWQARDGMIACDSLGHPDHDYIWLIHEREFADFELELEIRGFAESKGNSGVQIRSRYDRAAGWLDGPQIDIHPPDPWRTGLIYDENRETKRWVFPSLPDWRIDAAHAPKGWKWNAEGWNKLRVVAKGARIQTWLNEVPAADFDGKGILDDAGHRSHSVGLAGHIALQLHARDELKIQYRNLRIRELK